MILKVEISNTIGRVLNSPSQELYNDFRELFTLPAPGADYLHEVKLRNTLQELIKRRPISGSDMREHIYRLVPHDKPIRNRLNTISLRFDEEKLHAGQIAVKLCEYDKKHGSDGLVCMIGEDHTFLTGLLPTIIEWCEQKKLKLIVEDNREGTPEYNCTPMATLRGETAVQLRDYQQEVVKTALNNRLLDGVWQRGVLKVATGGGKSEIAVGLYQCNHLPTMFLVHRKDLMEQAAQRFEKYGIECGRIGDSEFKPSYSTVTVATIQTIWRILKNESDVRNGPLDALFNTTEQLFFDEAHLMAADVDKANTFIKISKKFEAANARWGLTATPFIKDDDFSNNLLRGATGNLLCDISNKALIERKFLTPPRVKMVTVEHPPRYEDPITRDMRAQPKGRGSSWNDVYEYVVTANPMRNQAIIDEIRAAPKPCLVLLQRKKHLEYLQAMGMPKYQVLTGSDSKKKRMGQVKLIREGILKVLVCTTIFDEGVDIPELQSVIMAGGGKSKIKTLQRLGRGLRLAEDKDEVLIVDFIDFNPTTPGWTAGKHSKFRMNTYKEEGFNVEIT
jgi:superfamily II DNA or RNA helicase